jgi:hypothetical protein
MFLEFTNDFIIPIHEVPFGVNTEKFKPDSEIVKDIDCILYKASIKLISC